MIILGGVAGIGKIEIIKGTLSCNDIKKTGYLVRIVLSNQAVSNDTSTGGERSGALQDGHVYQLEKLLLYIRF